MAAYQGLPPERYRGAMADHLFRQLDAAEEMIFRQWAHDNWEPTIPDTFSVWHPVIRDEWRKIDLTKPIFECDVCGEIMIAESIATIIAYGGDVSACDKCRGTADDSPFNQPE